MKDLAKTAIAAIIIAAPAPTFAQSMIDAFCGHDHANEVAAPGDVQANPDGFYVQSLKEQLSHGDPRIVRGVGDRFHLCTTSAATPDMDSTRAIQLMNERRVKFLFVPNDCPKARPGS